MSAKKRVAATIRIYNYKASRMDFSSHRIHHHDYRNFPLLRRSFLNVDCRHCSYQSPRRRRIDFSNPFCLENPRRSFESPRRRRSYQIPRRRSNLRRLRNFESPRRRSFGKLLHRRSS